MLFVQKSSLWRAFVKYGIYINARQGLIQGIEQCKRYGILLWDSKMDGEEEELEVEKVAVTFDLGKPLFELAIRFVFFLMGMLLFFTGFSDKNNNFILLGLGVTLIAILLGEKAFKIKLRDWFKLEVDKGDRGNKASWA